MGEPARQHDEQAAAERREELRTRRPSVWRSKSLRLMLVVTAIGLGMWVYAMATAPEPVSAAGAGAGGVAALNAGTATGGATANRLIDQSAPATFRLGFSFVVGFFLAWMLRKFIRTTLLIAGGIATLLIVLKATGLLNLDFSAIQGDVDRGLEAAQREASRFKEFILGYVPSGVSAAAGMVAGARRRR